ncbi:MAG TPA: hypothetical protein VK880_09870 [Anaerolineales bacterium]|nr:hypothetical protein [Anaerolineales bacterium]
MEELLRKIIDNHFSDLTGLTADASIPLSQALINELIAAVLQGNKTLQSCQVSVHEQNRVSVRLKTSALPWALDLKLKLDKSVDFSSFSSPKIRAWLENNQLLGSLGSRFNVFPEWAKLYGNQVVIDLGYFLPASEQKQLFELIKSVDIKTEEGKAIFDIKIEVE